MIVIVGIGQHHDLESGQETSYVRLQGESGAQADLSISGDTLQELAEFIGQEAAAEAAAQPPPRAAPQPPVQRRPRPRVVAPESDPNEAFAVGPLPGFDDVPAWDGE